MTGIRFTAGLVLFTYRFGTAVG